MTITRIQPVTSHPGENALFIVLGLSLTENVKEKIIDFSANFSALTRSLRNRFPKDNFNAVMGFSSNAWDMLFEGQPKPHELVTFKEIKGPKYTAVSTPGDLFFHIRAERQALCYELASIIYEQLKDLTHPVDEVHGFRYFDGRAILGFVDGTENPEPEIAAEYALVGSEDPLFAGGAMHLYKNICMIWINGAA